MKLWVTLEGKDAEVTFRTEGERLLLEVEGRSLEADFHRLPDGEVYSLLVDGRSHEVRVAQAGERLEVTLHGAAHPVEVRHPLEKLIQSARRESGARSGETVAAPIPGVLVALRVQRGDTVAPGQSVAVLEAMKMQNELLAHHGGVVVQTLVEEGASVGAGQAILKLEAQP